MIKHECEHCGHVDLYGEGPGLYMCQRCWEMVTVEKTEHNEVPTVSANARAYDGAAIIECPHCHSTQYDTGQSNCRYCDRPIW